MTPGNNNGEGGIRTHAPLRTNGFQDRLVMTTSIPLHIFICDVRLPSSRTLLDKYNTRHDLRQVFFLFFAKKFKIEKRTTLI